MDIIEIGKATPSMYAVIGGKKYETLTNVSFDPQIDITGQSLPINEFYVDIYTEDEIEVAQYAYLYDDRDFLYAKYWIIASEGLSLDVVSIQAQSLLAKLDKKMLKPHYYENDELQSILQNPPFNFNANDYYIDPILGTEGITGFCPAQTAKERLQWFCFVAGGYVKTFFSDKIEILTLDTESVPVSIPTNRVFWRPTLTETDFVTDINITSFSFTEQNTQPTTGEYVKVNNHEYYVVERAEMNGHQDPPKDIPTNEINISDVYLVNNSNCDKILSRLELIYFKHQELEADIINNAEYFPTDKVEVPIDPPDEEDGRDAIGFIDSCDFSFGLLARSRIHMIVQEIRETTRLTINYLKGNKKLGRKKYNLPIGYQYNIENPYLDQKSGQHRYIYYPSESDSATGTIVAGQNVNNQQFDVALHYNSGTGVLEVFSITSSSWKDQTERILKFE